MMRTVQFFSDQSKRPSVSKTTCFNYPSNHRQELATLSHSQSTQKAISDDEARYTSTTMHCVESLAYTTAITNLSLALPPHAAHTRIEAVVLAKHTSSGIVRTSAGAGPAPTPTSRTSGRQGTVGRAASAMERWGRGPSEDRREHAAAARRAVVDAHRPVFCLI